METRATDSTAVMRDHTTSSTIEKLRFGRQARGDNPDRSRLWAQLGVKYEDRSVGHRKIELGGEKLSSRHRKVADDHHLHRAINISLSLSNNFSLFLL
ncbi:hypothetical protein LOK49_LG03G03485 [Camellia lanceoleosa]|uniref:Uncharacterized protein n=1 Tax=Camellia lanceoleosa TaxID=1840588 RepID=A0ACC0IFI1_9ERIC|nr:hypothetical protein LOK49_LG03G03485 [Camellia lanceoleosa]